MGKRKLILYPKVVVKGQDLTKEPNIVVPNQSMSLREILTRFTRREALPVLQEGVYESRFDDLEAMKRQDPIDQLETREKINKVIKGGSERIKKEQDEAEAKAREEAIEQEVQKRVKGTRGEPPAPEPPTPKK